MLHPRMRYFGLAANRKGGRNYWAIFILQTLLNDLFKKRWDFAWAWAVLPSLP